MAILNSMVEAGSDWDRKNRLKVYEAMYLMSIRQFKKAAVLLLETISTFTAIELLDYQTYIYYTVLMAVVSMDRVTLKEKVINAPEILAVIDNIPHLNSLLNSIYNCQYAPFFVALGTLTPFIHVSR
jgi:26S proteasome regulatory subunit N7